MNRFHKRIMLRMVLLYVVCMVTILTTVECMSNLYIAMSSRTELSQNHYLQRFLGRRQLFQPSDNQFNRSPFFRRPCDRLMSGTTLNMFPNCHQNDRPY